MRKVDFSLNPPAISTIAGTGTCGVTTDPGPALSAQLRSPLGVAVYGGDVYLTDNGNCLVRKVSGGVISTVAGTGACSFNTGNGAATSIPFLGPAGIFVDGSGSVFVTDMPACIVREISGGTSTRIAGSGLYPPGYCGSMGTLLNDGGSPTAANLDLPTGVLVDPAGNLYIVDYANCRIRKVTAGVISTIAGAYAGMYAYCTYLGNGQSAYSSALFEPYGVALDPAGNLYISDWGDEHDGRLTRVAVIRSAEWPDEGEVDGFGDAP